MSDELYDVIIIGGGPAGLSAAQYTARARLKTIVLDKSPSASAISYTERIENYPGLREPLSGPELLDLFRDQANNFGAEYAETKVIGVALGEAIKEVYGMERAYRGKTVIIATGSMGRKPSIPGEEKFLGRGVSYCATCDAAFFKDQSVCVLGDSEEAVREAGVLTRFAKTVYLIAPIKGFTLTPDHAVTEADKIQVMPGSRVTSIQGNEVVTGVRLTQTETGEERDLAVDGVFVYLHGSQPVVDFLQSSIDLSEKSCIMTHRTTATSIPGVFAAGDVTCSEVRQVVVAAAFGCIAALSAEKYINQRKRMKFDWAKA